DDQLVHQRVRHSRYLDPRALRLGLAVRVEDLHFLPCRARVHSDHRVSGCGGWLSVAGDRLDRHLDGDRADVETTEAVHAEGIDGVRIFSRTRQERQEAAKVQRVEHGAQVDVERLGTLAGEDPDAGRGVAID